MSRAAAALAWLTLGVLLGRLWSAVERQPYQAKVRAERLEARAAAASCYGMIWDHWSNNHLTVPGTPDIVVSAMLLQDRFNNDLSILDEGGDSHVLEHQQR